MTSENREKRLLEALCEYMPYGLHVEYNGVSGVLHDLKVYQRYNGTDRVQEVSAFADFFGDGDYITIKHFKPFLRSVDSMTMDELEAFVRYKFETAALLREIYEITEVRHLNNCVVPMVRHRWAEDAPGRCWKQQSRNTPTESWQGILWLRRNFFDYGDLIEQQIALPAPKGMYAPAV